jgi:TRAP-type C4-dicarboxylate transport system permease small subunit
MEQFVSKWMGLVGFSCVITEAFDATMMRFFLESAPASHRKICRICSSLGETGIYQ